MRAAQYIEKQGNLIHHFVVPLPHKRGRLQTNTQKRRPGFRTAFSFLPMLFSGYQCGRFYPTLQPPHSTTVKPIRSGVAIFCGSIPIG